MDTTSSVPTSEPLFLDPLPGFVVFNTPADRGPCDDIIEAMGAFTSLHEQW